MLSVWEYFVIGVQLLAGFGLFFVGVRSFSESIQALFGSIIRKLINSVERRQFWNWGVGVFLSLFLVTGALTATMVIGFVNSGLLVFSQASSLLLGAYLGGAGLGWLLAFPFLDLNPMYFVALGLVIQLWLRNEKTQSVGRAVFALGLLLWGYMVMTSTFTVLRGSVALDPWWVHWGEFSFSLRSFIVGLGVISAFIMRAGGSLLGVVFALSLSGLISIEVGLLLLIGTTLGQALLPLVAALSYNRATQRVALVNFVAQLLAALVLVLFSSRLNQSLDALIPRLDSQYVAVNGLYIYAPIHLAFGQTLYFLISGLPFLMFGQQIEAAAMFLFPPRKVKEAQQLVFLGARFSLAPSLALEQAYQEVKKMAAMVQTMLSLTESALKVGKIEAQDFRRVAKYEKITDNIQREVFAFLEAVMAAHLTAKQAKRVRSLLRMADELESIADQCLIITSHFQVMNMDGHDEVAQDLKDLANLLTEVLRFYEISFAAVTEAAKSNIEEHTSEISEFAKRFDSLRSTILERQKLPLSTNLERQMVSELLSSSLIIKEHTVNVIEAFHGGNKMTLT
jgi:phosphate:Na+ symporter